MPTKRRFIIFLIVLTLMLLIKRAVGQEAAVGWDPQYVCFAEPGIGEQSIAAWLFGLVFGSVGGFARAQQRLASAEKGQFFTGDLIQLRLQ